MQQKTSPDNQKNMEMYIDYTIHENKITVISCKGYGDSISLPSHIKGIPVTRVGAYAFSDIDKSRECIPLESRIFTERIPGITIPGWEAEYIFGRKLKEISLPKDLEVIDEYAFYDCRELAAIHMWSGRIQLENGVFMNCEKLMEVYVNGNAEEVTCVSGILSEISEEVCINFSSDGERGVFIFPEFYEDSIENTPARVFHYLIYGAGYRYRQCFEQGRLNILAYDTVFQSAEIQNIQETALKIAFARIQYPYQLHETIRNKYINYITLHMDAAVDLMLSTDNLEGIVFLTELGVMTENNYTAALSKAVNTGKKECASILLKEKLHYYPPAGKTFEL